ncbi:hypothetical protein [Thiothrix sp.]|jgi:hypothetical protein|uniref:hypothetical protein n=1 Tax=Thiothrix sp. TaxID=1032 RepID=UPI00257CA01E|nr:hypothetical protein [Thiothrix sp.]
MTEFDWQAKKLAALCPELSVGATHEELLHNINILFASLNLSFEKVLERGGWHHLGGVVDINMQPVASNLRLWAETESGGDIETLLDKCSEQILFATKISGTTLYFTASTGDKPQDFLQLEVEVLQEVLDRPLSDPDFLPDSVEEFLDPVDFPRLEPEAVGKPHYRFRRLQAMAEVFADQNFHSRHVLNLLRFMQDWQNSSAGHNDATFCEHWVMVLQAYQGSDKAEHYNIKPTSTFTDKVTDFAENHGLHGAEMAKALHSFDRKVGYPFAWYFLMLNRKGVPTTVADAVLRDQMEAYAYLPARDLKILREWEQRSYSV